MKNVKNKFNKELIKELPRALFEGTIEVIDSTEDVKRAVALLEQSDILGLDTETRPNFRGGRQNKVALLQISTREVCFLFRLKQTGMSDELVNLFTNPTILKVGLSLRDDFRQLRSHREFEPVNYVELQDFVKPFGIQDLSLQKLYANILGGQIHKGQQLSNWEAETLSDAQQKYAATDAWACIMLFEEMQRMRRDGFQVVYAPGEVPAPVCVGMTEQKAEVEVSLEDAIVEQASERTKSRKKSKKLSPVTEVKTEINSSTEDISTLGEQKEIKDAPSIPSVENSKRHKKRKSSKPTSENQLSKQQEDKQPNANITIDKQKRSNRRKKNNIHAEEPQAAESNVISNDNKKESNKSQKSTRTGKGPRYQGSEKRREASRRPIPEMAAPLDEEPNKKKGGFMKKVLLGIVEKFS